VPKITTEKKQYLVARVRSVIAQDHQIGLDDLAARLERDYGIRIERHYLSGIVRKIYRERALRADRQTLNFALASFEDVMTQVVRVAWEIANDQFARKQDRVMALREIREAHSALFTKLFDAGVFERKLGTLDQVIRNIPLTDEKKQAIRATFENWGLLQAPPVLAFSCTDINCPERTGGKCADSPTEDVTSVNKSEST
jgi:hypothetical protein